jgi:hypothetical protein
MFTYVLHITPIMTSTIAIPATDNGLSLIGFVMSTITKAIFTNVPLTVIHLEPFIRNEGVL